MRACLRACLPACVRAWRVCVHALGRAGASPKYLPEEHFRRTGPRACPNCFEYVAGVRAPSVPSDVGPLSRNTRYLTLGRTQSPVENFEKIAASSAFGFFSSSAPEAAGDGGQLWLRRGASPFVSCTLSLCRFLHLSSSLRSGSSRSALRTVGWRPSAANIWGGVEHVCSFGIDGVGGKHAATQVGQIWTKFGPT